MEYQIRPLSYEIRGQILHLIKDSIALNERHPYSLEELNWLVNFLSKFDRVFATQIYWIKLLINNNSKNIKIEFIDLELVGLHTAGDLLDSFYYGTFGGWDIFKSYRGSLAIRNTLPNDVMQELCQFGLQSSTNLICTSEDTMSLIQVITKKGALQKWSNHSPYRQGAPREFQRVLHISLTLYKKLPSLIKILIRKYLSRRAG